MKFFFHKKKNVQWLGSKRDEKYEYFKKKLALEY